MFVDKFKVIFLNGIFYDIKVVHSNLFAFFRKCDMINMKNYVIR